MATVSIPNNTATTLLAADNTKAPKKALWIQNFSTTVGFSLVAKPGHNDTADPFTASEELYLAPATSATEPTTLLTDTPALVSARWLAKQASGGAVNLNVGRF
mgnify:FL=1